LDKDRQRIIKDWEDKKGAAFDEPHRRSCAERHAPTTSALLDLGTAGPKPDTPTPQLLLSLKAACGECNEEFAGNGQNDAHEFLITLLGVIDQEVCRSKPEAYETMKDVEDECKRDAYARWTERLRRENNSTIYDFFGGVTGSTVQCATCFLISYRFEAQLDISLPMAYNSGPRAAAAPRSGANEGKNGKARPDEVVAVDLLLHDMFFSDRGEFLSGAMQVTCDRCKKLRDKTIWSTIEQWPPILVLHLKRFNNAGVKNESAVVFPYTFCPFGRVKYQLYGVCCHRGTASFGHYTSYVYTGGGDASTADLLLRSSTTLRDDERAAEDTGAGAFCSPPSGSFARSVDGNFGIGAECDLPRGKNVTQGRTHGGGGGNDRGSDGAGGNGEKWYFCNDECITTVTPSEVVSKTKEAYILFYRRVA
jgi:ubiquitin C-terminal hydrolase